MSQHSKAVKAFNRLKKYCVYCSDCKACVFYVKKCHEDSSVPIGCCLDVHHTTNDEDAEIIANLMKKEFGVYV